MNYTERVIKTETVELTGNWDTDVQRVISLALQLNNNSISEAHGWISSKLDVTGNYETAVKREAVQQLMKERMNCYPYGKELGKCFDDIFGDLFRR